MPQQLTQFAGAAKMMWRLLERRGIDPAPVYRDVGIEVEGLQEKHYWVPVERMDRLWRAVIARVDDDCFALEAQHCWRPGDLHALGYIWQASATLRRAIEALVRYIELVDQSARLELIHSDDRTLLCSDAPRGGYKNFPQLRECFFALLVHLARLSAGADFAPVKVSFRHPARHCEARFQAWFRCPLEFSAMHDSIAFSDLSLDQPLSSTIPGVAQAIERVIVADIAKARSDRISDQVRGALMDALPSGQVDIDDIATGLNMSHDELMRRLHHEQTSFRAILDALRQQLSRVYISDPLLSLSEIAFLLGFSDQSAFTRAFKRWFGTAPRKYRDREPD